MQRTKASGGLFDSRFTIRVTWDGGEGDCKLVMCGPDTYGPIRSDICLRIRISALFGSIRRRLNGRSLRTGKCHDSLGGHRRGHANFHDFKPGERRYHDRPGRPPDLCRPRLFYIREVDFDLEADSLAFNVLELPEGLLGDIDCILDASRGPISKIFARSKVGKAVDGKRAYIVGLPWSNVHQSRGIGIGDDVGGNSRCGAWCCRSRRTCGTDLRR